LDTQTFLIAAVQGLNGFSRKLRHVLENPAVERCMSAISITEIAIKNSIGKLEISSADVSEATRDLTMTILPFTNTHAHRMFKLPLHHREPFDRMIIAVALEENLPVASGDGQFRKYSGLRVIW
jgi:PIN domain nuclease of toxin-antitoxin system